MKKENMFCLSALDAFKCSELIPRNEVRTSKGCVSLFLLVLLRLMYVLQLADFLRSRIVALSLPRSSELPFAPSQGRSISLVGWWGFIVSPEHHFFSTL